MTNPTETLVARLVGIAERYPLEVVPLILIMHLISAAKSVGIPRSSVRNALRQDLQKVRAPRTPDEVLGWPKGHLEERADFEMYAHMLDSDINHLWPEAMSDINVVLNSLVALIVSLVLAGVRKDYILNTFDEEWDHTDPGDTLAIDPRRRQRTSGGDLNG